ncbi:MAG: hypothetical protein IPO21_19685 [Bacteroidales bacterium]|nr:hypothetical protein [Bacteroidales bacterium]
MGYRISSNDTYADIYEEFIDLYNEGLEVPEITQKLIDENQDTINTPEDASNFWFAIANGQWECKALDIEILSKVETIIQSGEDLRVWKQLDASEKDLKAREKVLNKFLLKLQSVKDKPRKRTKKKLYDSIFKKGDCLIYKMDNGNYGGAFVLSEEKESLIGINIIAITINKSERPTIEDFKVAHVYIKRLNGIYFGKGKKQKWIDQPQIGGFYAISYKNNELEIEVIGQLPIYYEYKRKADNLNIGFGWLFIQPSLCEIKIKKYFHYGLQII